MFLPAADSQVLKLVLTSLGPYSGFKDPIKLTRISTDVPETPEPVHLVLCLLNGWCFAARVFRSRRGASDEHIPKWICKE